MVIRRPYGVPRIEFRLVGYKKSKCPTHWPISLTLRAKKVKDEAGFTLLAPPWAKNTSLEDRKPKSEKKGVFSLIYPTLLPTQLGLYTLQ